MSAPRKWPSGGGIYALCICDQPKYVGNTAQFSKRWSQHRYQLRKGEHHNRELQTLYDKYGESSLGFSILERQPESGKTLAHSIEFAWMVWFNYKYGLTNVPPSGKHFETTPHALALKSGLSTATIYPMAHNNAKRVSLDVLQRLADTLAEMTGEKITAADLLEVE